MAYLIGKIIICLLLASLFGVVIGWLLKRFFDKKQESEQLRRFEDERTQHQQHIIDLEHIWQSKYTVLNETNSDINDSLEVSKQENEVLTNRNKMLDNEIRALHEENKQTQPLTEELTQLKQQQATYQDDLSHLIQEKQVLEEAQQCLSKENNEYEEALCEMGCLKEQLVALTNDRDQIQTKINQLSTELSTEQQCTAELREKNRIMQTAAKSDNLQKINGIGKANEKALKAQGVTCYAQIAAFTADDEKKYGNSLGVFSARITQEEWVKQAKQLHKEKYGEEI